MATSLGAGSIADRNYWFFCEDKRPQFEEDNEKCTSSSIYAWKNATFYY